MRLNFAPEKGAQDDNSNRRFHTNGLQMNNRMVKLEACSTSIADSLDNAHGRLSDHNCRTRSPTPRAILPRIFGVYGNRLADFHGHDRVVQARLPFFLQFEEPSDADRDHRQIKPRC